MLSEPTVSTELNSQMHEKILSILLGSKHPCDLIIQSHSMYIDVSNLNFLDDSGLLRKLIVYPLLQFPSGSMCT